MRAVELTSHTVVSPPLASHVIPRIARGLLLMLLALVYSGGLQFLISISSYLLYGSYIVMLLCIIVCMFGERYVKHDLGVILPYFIWVVFYCIWGTIWSSDKELVLPDVVRLLLRHMLLLIAIVIGLADRRSLKNFVYLVQLVALINFGISVWEINDPRLISDIAYTLNNSATAFNELRPAGLWSNPNEAAFAFLFVLLLSHWSRGVLAWLGRAGSILGIYLTASRTGIYLLLLCAVLMLLHRFYMSRLTPSRMAMMIIGLTLAICLGWAVLSISDLRSFDISNNWNVSRVLDFSEIASDRTTRIEITNIAAEYALNGPWYGYGVFTFQGGGGSNVHSLIEVGAHNIYLTVFGEVGIFGLVSYLMILIGTGFARLFRTEMLKNDKFILFLMWIVYLVIGLAWHNQISSLAGIIYIGMLYHLIRIMILESHPAISSHQYIGIGDL